MTKNTVLSVDENTVLSVNLSHPNNTGNAGVKSKRPVIRDNGKGEEMIREEDKPAWRNFWLKVVPFLVAVLFFSFACWGGK